MLYIYGKFEDWVKDKAEWIRNSENPAVPSSFLHVVTLLRRNQLN